jgi:hypothetical protein
MTESQLHLFPAFRSLPVYDEGDARADSITSLVVTGAYRRLRECTKLQEVEDCLKDSRLVPLGALRAREDGGAVVAYFGEKL